MITIGQQNRYRAVLYGPKVVVRGSERGDLTLGCVYTECPDRLRFAQMSLNDDMHHWDESERVAYTAWIETVKLCKR